ncbi:hypothetical protein [Streptomyces sp. AC495_CC817]|uniref:hypothetical protein n=1 Tax=Streptomyces sp. AC495_CC817 TaxID=2823900 RepID=UPI001C251A4A|nr:hypothetical protein [Streptomyces sp. AC495_CC817]
MRAATFFDGEEWREGTLVELDGRMLLRDETPSAALPRFDGAIIGGVTDHHVHLQLVEAALLSRSRLGRVIDLGGDPSTLSQLAAVHNSGRSGPSGSSGGVSTPEPLDSPESCTRRARVEFAGAFLTPVGGYPSDRSWAPAGSVRELSTPAEAASAVAEMAEAGATRVKVASNSTAGPVFDDEVFRAIVAAAGSRGLPVVAHAEGAGQARRAARLGARMLAHSPFTERLTDAEISEQVASVTWISTLSIHDTAAREVAIDNVRRFHAAGGVVRYGTDMGNGPTPVDLNPLEVAALREAGIDGLDLLHALAPADPRDAGSVLLQLPDPASDPLDARLLKV